LDAQNNFHGISNIAGIYKSAKQFSEKRESGRGCGAELGQPKSGGLPRSGLTESLRHRPI
jgi:hypothetical protein